MTKHTRVPWTVQDGEMIDILNHRESTIAVVYHKDDGSCVAPDTSKQEALANAHLIAAAPELLESVATLYGLAGFQSLLKTKYSAALVDDIMRQMDEALNKARGGE